jgi:hypothetical protein
MVSDDQVRVLRKKLMDGKTLEAAAAAAGMSERTARSWLSDGLLPSQAKGPRAWRTRPDPFVEVWSSEVLPLLAADVEGKLQGRTVFDELVRRHPGLFKAGQLRTLQRRMRDWRAISGPEREVFFPQDHVPGREGAFDFTNANELGITIAGERFEHLLFEFVLSYSGWFTASIAHAETFEALLLGLQGAVFELGGSPTIWRSDNLSAATHELKVGGRGLTARYRELVGHYGVESTRIGVGKSNENGVVEQRHYRTKTALDQALRLRGSREFPTIEAYRVFLREVVETARAKSATRLAEERPLLLPLPSSALPASTTYHPRVSCWSTMRVGGRFYSVPSRLIGEQVEARQHPDVVEVYYKGRLLETMPRLRGDKKERIDYRHVIWSLVRKPGAFARYRYREELFPALVFRRAYDALVKRTERADIEYVRILHLAASTMQGTVERVLTTLLATNEPFDYAAVARQVKPATPSRPVLNIPAPDLTTYDRLLAMGGGR